MPTGLAGLVAFLVDQIALCGEAGATPSNFIAFVRSYYNPPPSNDGFQSSIECVSRSSSPDRLQIVDQSFLDFVWGLLTQDPEIHVGKDGVNAGIRLDEAQRTQTDCWAPPVAQIWDAQRNLNNADEHRNISNVKENTVGNDHNGARLLPRSVVDDKIEINTVHSPINIRDVSPFSTQEVHGSSELAVSCGSCTNPNVLGQDITTSEPALTKPLQSISDTPGVRLYTTQRRMWYALAGHEPDTLRIKNLDFVLLSIIAACGPTGIAQHELVLVSGQDKRSVPTRTDRLHDDGYILKQSVELYFSNPKPALRHTSLCSLRRFESSSRTIATRLTAEARALQIAALKGRKKKVKRKPQVDAVMQSVGPSVDSTSSPHLEAIGQVEQLQTQPVETDTGPQWTPDRSLGNQIYGLVHGSGSRGMTMNEIGEALFGSDSRKPVELHLARLVDAWQSSQPLHLRHLAMVRDAVQRNKSPVYIHYSFENYKHMVERGEKIWEAVLSNPTKKKKKDTTALADAQLRLDVYGFPPLDGRCFQGRTNDATLSECAIAIPVERGSALAGIRKQRSLWGGKKTTTVRKGAGRPRKYQLGEVPKDIGTWDTEEVKNFYKSRFMHEKYQKAKITDEIDRRVVKGEASATAVRKVIEDTRALQEREGLARLPKSLINQILHHYQIHSLASEPSLEKDIQRPPAPIAGLADDKAIEEYQDASQALIYYPSVLSHSSIVYSTNGPGLSYRPSLAGHNGLLVIPDTSYPTLPSTQPNETEFINKVPTTTNHFQCPSEVTKTAARSGLELTQSGSQQKKGRPPKSSSKKDVERDYVISDDIYPAGIDKLTGTAEFLTLTKEPLKSSKGSGIFSTPNSFQVGSGSDDQPMQTHVAELSQRDERKCVILEMKDGASEHVEMAHPSAIDMHMLMLPKYEEISHMIPRSRNGIYFSSLMQRYKRRDDPPWMTTRTIRLAIIKTPSLKRTRDLDESYLAPQSAAMSEPQERSQDPADYIFALPPAKRPSWFVDHASSSCQEQRTVQHHSGEGDFAEQNSPSLLQLSNNDDDVQQASLQEPSRKIDVMALSHGTYMSPDLIRARDPVQPGRIHHTQPLISCMNEKAHIQEASRSAVVHGWHHDSNMSKSSNMNLLGMVQPSPNSDTSVEPTCQQQVRPISPNLGDMVSSGTQPDASSDSPVLSATRSVTHGQKSPQYVPLLTSNDNFTANQVVNCQTRLGLDQTTESIIGREWKRQQSTGTERFSRLSGSTAILRRNIVLHLVQKCGGVFPGGNAMTIPFGHEWTARGQPGLPERKTVRNAAQATCAAGKIQQITFSFKDKHGITATSDVYALASMDVRDPRILHAQRLIAEHSPSLYVPLAVMGFEQLREKLRRDPDYVSNLESGSQHSPEVTKLLETTRKDLAHKAAEKKQRICNARTIAMQGPAQREIYLKDLENVACTKEERAMLARTVRTWKPSVERLQTIRRSKPKSTSSPPENTRSEKAPTQRGPLVANERASVNHPVTPLLWLTEGYSFTVDNYEHGRPSTFLTILSPRIAIEKCQNEFRTSTREEQLRSSGSPKRHDADQSANGLPRSDIVQTGATFAASRRHVLPGFMNPKHLYHKMTGTFSTSFEGSYLPPSNCATEPVSRQTTFQVENASQEQKRKWSDCTQTQPASAKPYMFLDSLLVFHPLTGTFATPFFGFRTDLRSPPVKKTRSRAYTPKLSLTQHKTSSRLDAEYTISPRGELDASHSTLPHLEGETLREANPTRRKPSSCRMLSHLQAKSLPGIRLAQGGLSKLEELHTVTPSTLTDSTTKLTSESSIRNPLSQKLRLHLSRRDPDPEFVVDLQDDIAASGRGPAIVDVQPKSVQRRTRLKRARDSLGYDVGDARDKTADVAKDRFGRSLKKLRRQRLPQTTELGDNGEFRLFTACIVVRILTGGLAQRINWDLVARAFEQDLNINKKLVKSKKGAVFHKYKDSQPSLIKDFQALFINAYKAREVPQIDYDNLKAYDWKWLVQWTMDNLGAIKDDSLETLPPNKPAFDRAFALENSSEERLISQYYELDGPAVIQLRQAVINRHTYAACIKDCAPQVVPKGPTQGISNELRYGPARADLVAVAGSWIRANIITSNIRHDRAIAAAKFETLPNIALEIAIKDLLQRRCIVDDNKNERLYHFHPQFHQKLKRNITPAQYDEATAFKFRLDKEFQKGDAVPWSNFAGDGEALAVLNLVAYRRVKLIGIDKPSNKSGLTGQGYATRQMDKGRLCFQMHIEPTSCYLYGRPLGDVPAPPTLHQAAGENDTGRLPLWHDINGDPVLSMWRNILAAVMALLATRPGSGPQLIGYILRPTLDTWEIEVVLEWLVRCNFARRVGEQRYISSEWWWMCLESAHDPDTHDIKAPKPATEGNVGERFIAAPAMNAILNQGKVA